MALTQPASFQNPAVRIPILVQLGLTYRCNLRCTHCYALYRRNRNELTLREIANLAKELYDAGGAAVVFSHGENMIRRDFYKAASVFCELGFYQTLMLNGFYVRSFGDAQRLADAGINRAMISVDSADSAVHDRIRGKAGAFDQAMTAADLLLQSRVETVGFSCTIDRHNYDSISDIASLALRRGVKAISFMQNRYNLRDVFDRSVWLKYADVCRNLYELMLHHRGQLDIYTHDPFMLSLLDDRLDDETARADFIGANLCNVAASMVSIDPAGNVTGCNFISDVIGNVREESFASIWERLIARYVGDVTSHMNACSGCNVRHSCAGGCKAYHYIGKYDERCGEARFGEDHPHGLPVAKIDAVSPDRAAGVFLNVQRFGSRLLDSSQPVRI